MTNIPLISVVIPTYGPTGVDLTKACLESFWTSGLTKMSEADAETIGFVPEIIVVDDGSSQSDFDRLEAVCRENGVYKLIHNDTNTGHFAFNVNLGLKATNGQFVFMMNNDVELLPGCLQTLVAHMASYNFHLVAPKLLYPDLGIQFAGTVYVHDPDQPDQHGWFDHFLRFQPRWHPGACMARSCLLTGALLGMQRSLIETIGYLDERFELAAEDVDFCLRALASKMGVQYVGYAEAVHKEGMTRGKTLEEKKLHPEWTDREKRSLEFLWDKWPTTEFKMFGPSLG